MLKTVLALTSALCLFGTTSALTGCGGGGGGGDGLLSNNVDLRAKAISASSVSLSWSGCANTNMFYVVARSDDQSQLAIASTASCSYTVSGLSSSTRYCFVIRAQTIGVTLSNRACATTLSDSSSPSSPTNLVAKAISPAQVDLSWNPASDDVAVAGYKLYRNNTYRVSVSGTTVSDKDVKPSVNYCYGVSAYDASGNESAPTSQVCVTMPSDAERPTAPTRVTAVYSPDGAGGVITVNWDASSDDGRVEHYQMYRDGVSVATVIDVSFVDSDLMTDVLYCYVVVAVDTSGKTSDPSSEACARQSWRQVALPEEYFALQIFSPAIGLDAADVAHLAYEMMTYDASSNDYRVDLRYVRLEPNSTPTAEFLERGMGSPWELHPLSLAVQPNGDTHILHFLKDVTSLQAEIRYVKVGEETVGQRADALRAAWVDSISVASDSSGTAHACVVVGYVVFYGSNAGGTWTFRDAGELAPYNGGASCDIAIDADDSIHMSYVRSSANWELMYLTDRSGVWTQEAVDSRGANPNGGTAIVIDSNRHAHIAYLRKGDTYDLEYATNRSGAWVTTTVDTAVRGFDGAGMTIDATNALHMAYCRGDNDLMYATNGNNAWVSKEVGEIGWQCGLSIAVDSQRKAHVVFPDGSRLRYLTNRE